MKNHLKIIIFIFILAISNFIGIGKVRGIECDPSQQICADSGSETGNPTSGLGNCASSYKYCIVGMTTSQVNYFVLDVYDVNDRTHTYYYDFDEDLPKYVYSDLLNKTGSYGGPLNGAYTFKLSDFISNLSRSNPSETWYKLDTYESDFATSDDKIKSNNFNDWLYVERRGADFSNLEDATKALRQKGQLYIVRISVGIILTKNPYGNKQYVATDNFFNTTGSVDKKTDLSKSAFIARLYLAKSWQNYLNSSTKDRKYNDYNICMDGSSIQTLCGYCYFGSCKVWDNGILDTVYWFTDEGRLPKEDPTCEWYCSADNNYGEGKYADLGSDACKQCCDNVNGHYVINETKDQCSNILTCTKPSSLPPESTYGEVKCGGTYNIDFYTNDGAICDGIPIYNHVQASIHIPDGSITLLNNRGQLVSNPFAVAGKGFNWDTTFDGTIASNRYLDSRIKDKYKEYANCVKQRNDQINSKISELQSYQADAKDNNDAYNSYQAQIEQLTESLTDDEGIKTIQECNNKIQNNNPTSTATPITNDDIQILNRHFKAIGYNIDQDAGEIKYIPKNLGDPFKNNNISSSVRNKLDFFVPITIPNKTRGVLSLTAKINNQYLSNSEMGQIFIECPIVISSYVDCQDDDKCLDDDDNDNDDDDCEDPNDPNCHFFQCDDPNGCTTGLNLIYRPVSLTDPFPNRTEGYNWQGKYNNKEYKDIFITNSRGVSDNKIYQEEPMYVITLTPTDIKEIREYNKSHSYNDFNLTCDEHGLYCKSEFIKDYSQLFKSGTCGLVGDWYACYTQNQKVAVEEILAPMKW